MQEVEKKTRELNLLKLQLEQKEREDKSSSQKESFFLILIFLKRLWLLFIIRIMLKKHIFIVLIWHFFFQEEMNRLAKQVEAAQKMAMESHKKAVEADSKLQAQNLLAQQQGAAGLAACQPRSAMLQVLI